MNNFSISRIILILATLAAPWDAFALFSIMIGGGLPYDPKGYYFWLFVLLFLIGLILLPFAWKHQDNNKILPIVTIILFIAPTLLTFLLG